MPWSIGDMADTVYDNSHPWDSLYNGINGGEVCKPDARQQKLMAQAQLTADRSTPDDFIRANMTSGPPVDFGPRRPEPTIGTVLSGQALQPQHLYDRPPTDFSGTVAGIDASSRNSIAVG